MKKALNSSFLPYFVLPALLLAVVFIWPAEAGAGYSFNYFGTPMIGSYSYSQPTHPVYVERPIVINPVYVEQPVYITRPAYVPPVIVYPALQVYCNPDSVNTRTGNVTWRAFASGGDGRYEYSWSGTDGLYGYGKNIYKTYYSYGQKYASVTVRSGNQTVTQGCTNSVTYSPSYYPYQETYSSYQTAYIQVPATVISNGSVSGNLDIGCYVDPTSLRVDQPAVWKSEVSGGIAPYTYSWSGSEGLSGSQGTVIKYYGTAGSKNAVLTVTSADGRSAMRACSNTATVAEPYAATSKVVETQTVSVAAQIPSSAPVANNAAAAVSLPAVSMSNLPWGWLAVIIIFILFSMVVYLMGKRNRDAK